MQQTLENKFTSMIAKRNSPKYISKKSRLSFSLLFLVGFAAGILVFSFGISDGYISVCPDYINKHFSSIFVECDTFSGYISHLLKVSGNDLKHLLLVFVSGFTYFCFIAVSAISFAKGFTLSFSVSYMIAASSSIDTVDVCIGPALFFFVKLITSIILINLSVRSYIFSYDFRSIKQNCSILRRSPYTYRYVLAFISAVGYSLLINLVYCIGISIIQV